MRHTGYWIGSLILVLSLWGCGREQKSESVLSAATAAQQPTFDVFLVLDQSDSMSGKGLKFATDPEGLRVKAAQYFVDYLSHYSSPQVAHRVAVVNFGSDTPADIQIPLTSLSEPGAVASLKEKVKPLSLGETSFIRALEKTEELFRQGGGFTKGRIPVLIVFTDGEPNDDLLRRVRTKEAYFQEMARYLQKEFQVPRHLVKEGAAPELEVFVIGVDLQGKFWNRDAPLWKRISGGKTFLIQTASEAEWDDIYAQILMDLLGFEVGAWQEVEAEGGSVEVEPYLEKVTFTVLRDKPNLHVQLNIYNPRGGKLGPENCLYSHNEGYDIYSVSEPEPGQWRYEIAGGKGKVKVKKDKLPIRFALIRPGEAHPLGKEMVIEASFSRRDGGPVAPLPNYRLHFSGEVFPPGEKDKGTLVEFVEREPGLFYGARPIPVHEAGAAKIRLSVYGGSYKVSDVSVNVHVKPMPYLQLTSPEEQGRYSLYNPPIFWRPRPLSVSGVLKENQQTLNAREIFQEDPKVILSAQLVSGPVQLDQSVIPLEPESVENAQVFTGALTGLNKPGFYTVATTLRGTLRATGELYVLTERAQFYLVEGREKYVRLALFGCAVFGLMVMVSRARQPRLTGTLYANGTEYPLGFYGKRVKIGRGERIPAPEGYTGSPVKVRGVRGKDLEGRPASAIKVIYKADGRKTVYSFAPTGEGSVEVPDPQGTPLTIQWTPEGTQ